MNKLDQIFEMYESSVQNPEAEVEILQDNFLEIRGRKALSLREDFCGTGYLMSKWVQQGSQYVAYGVDLDEDPMIFGRKRHVSLLTDDQQKRVKYIKGNVLDSVTPKVDISVALNFSYYIFKRRSVLVNYFKHVLKHLKNDGVFFLDLFGGPDSQTVLEEKRQYKGFTYFWDCAHFNPITNECLFYIHFQPKGKNKIKKAFEYDWRMWTFPEIREALVEAGFKKTIAYWEKENRKGEGTGIYYATDKAENSASWVAYIAALK